MYIKLTLTDPVTKEEEEGFILITRETHAGITKQEVHITNTGYLCILRIMVKGPFDVDKERYPRIGKFFKDSDKKMKIIMHLRKVLKRLFFKMCIQAMTIVKMTEFAMVKLYEEICLSDIRVFAVLILRMSTWRETVVDVNGTQTTNLRDLLQIFASPEVNSANVCDETFCMQMSLCNYIQDQCGDSSEIGLKADKLVEFFKDTRTNKGFRPRRMEISYGRQLENTIVYCSWSYIVYIIFSRQSKLELL